MRKVVTVAILAVAMAVVVALNWDALTSNPNSAQFLWQPTRQHRTRLNRSHFQLLARRIRPVRRRALPSHRPQKTGSDNRALPRPTSNPSRKPPLRRLLSQPNQFNEPSALDIAKQAAARFAAAAPDKALTIHRSSTDSAKPKSEVSPSVSQEPRTEVKARKPVEPKTTPTTKDSKALSALDKAKMAGVVLSPKPFRKAAKRRR